MFIYEIERGRWAEAVVARYTNLVLYGLSSSTKNRSIGWVKSKDITWLNF